MIRTFNEWWLGLPKDVREIIPRNEGKRPQLSQINYIWVTNLINKNSNELNPTTTELLEWIKSEQVDALRK